MMYDGSGVLTSAAYGFRVMEASVEETKKRVHLAGHII